MRMSQPFGQAATPAGRILYDPAGNLYFADTANHLIRKIDPAGVVHRVAGTPPLDGVPQNGFSGDGGPATDALLDFPVDLALAEDGTLYFTDVHNHCVRAIDPTGTIRTVAGVCGTRGFSGDGGPPDAALLNLPFGVAYAGGRPRIANTGSRIARSTTLSRCALGSIAFVLRLLAGCGDDVRRACRSFRRTIATPTSGSRMPTSADHDLDAIRIADPLAAAPYMARDSDTGGRDPREGGVRLATSAHRRDREVRGHAQLAPGSDPDMLDWGGSASTPRRVVVETRRAVPVATRAASHPTDTSSRAPFREVPWPAGHSRAARDEQSVRRFISGASGCHIGLARLSIDLRGARVRRRLRSATRRSSSRGVSRRAGCARSISC